MKQSQQLTEFYRAYKAWLDGGAPAYEIFSHHVGLCSSLIDWNIHRCATLDECEDTRKELKEQLIAKGLDEYYPFGGQPVYEYEARSSTAFMNEERIAWVEAHVEG